MLRELIGWALLAVALALTGLAINGVRPVRGSRVLLLPSFLAGTLLAETSVFILPLVLAGAATTAWLGEPRTAPGWLALTLTSLAGVLLIGQLVSSLRATTTLRADVPEFSRARKRAAN